MNLWQDAKNNPFPICIFIFELTVLYFFLKTLKNDNSLWKHHIMSRHFIANLVCVCILSNYTAQNPVAAVQSLVNYTKLSSKMDSNHSIERKEYKSQYACQSTTYFIVWTHALKGTTKFLQLSNNSEVKKFLPT